MGESRNVNHYTWFTDERKMVFLEHYKQFGLKGQACDAANVCLQTVNDHLKDDKKFATDFEEAQQTYRDQIEQEIKRRAIDGVTEYVTCGKGLVFIESTTEFEEIRQPDGSVVRRGKMVPLKRQIYSDFLLLAHARRHIPEYRDKATLDVNHQGGVLLIPAGQTTEEWKAANAPVEKPPIEHKP